MKHPTNIEGYSGSLEDLAKAIGSMRYDKVYEFLNYLMEDIENQARNDAKKNRLKLSSATVRAPLFMYNSAWQSKW